ncbi:hypothetical protein SAMN05216238_1122 [Lentibacillus persicus]|uniref:Regulatory protein YrvL n=1 Tax=Lentibacillus persicus TaxID=640948 RepID=A0A1I1ZCR6_9BACI|nr:hypothetical protein [Lentibacillus persicus]SFE28110.1 hypothetical protein SAMN05216238_1122 [Lentibacillus persicus]
MDFNLYHVYILRNLIKFCKKIGVALISVIILILIWSFSSEDPFLDLVMIGLFYLLPAYLIFGIPISFLIEKIVQKLSIISKPKLYFLNLFLYGFAGFLIVFIPVMLSGEMILNFKFFSFTGVTAALIFYHISLIFENPTLR